MKKYYKNGILSNRFYRAYRSVNNISEDISDDAISNIVWKGILEQVELIEQHLKRADEYSKAVIKKYTQIEIEQKSIYDSYSRALLQKLFNRMINAFLNYSLKDIDSDEYKLDLAATIAGFSVECKSEATSFISKLAKFSTKKPELRQQLLDEHLDIVSIPKIYSKIEDGANNQYLHFLKETANYLKETSLVNDVTDIHRSEPNAKTLVSLFIDTNIYFKLIDFMCDENLLAKRNNHIIWKGFRSKAKYEISSFHEALFNTNFLKTKALNDSDLIHIAKNTFYDFNAVERTMRNKDGLPKKILLYNEMLQRFKRTYT